MTIENTLAQFDSAFESAEVTTNATIDLPEGKYEAKVTGTEIFESGDGRNFFRINMEVANGEMKGTKFSKLHGLDNPERFKYLKGDLTVCGLMLGKLSELPAQMNRIHGVKLRVQCKKNGQYTNYYINGQVFERKDDSNVPF